ncbi:MAG: amino acid racemase [Candidatus Latescibacterota bacterium]|nr:MAG: amino acid racemase [Candidatus Latescibacterota bacterium]
MKTIGIIGGLGPETTLEYYHIITSSYQKQVGGQSYPKIIIYSVNLGEFIDAAEAGAWDKVAGWLSHGVEMLHRAEADFAMIAANTPHVVFDEVNAGSPIPMISIVEETVRVAKQLGLRKLGLFGTKFTMRADYYQKVFSRERIDIVVPDPEDQDYIYDKILNELVIGEIVADTRDGLLSIVRRMIDESSIQGLILGCTELPLILTKDEFGIPFLNTTRIHAESALPLCLPNRHK